MAQPHVIFASILSPVSPSEVAWFPDGALVINNQGILSYVGSRNDLPAELAAQPQRFTSNLIAPGFIDLHTHLPQYYCRGRYAPSLLEWLERYVYPEELKFTDPDYARAISRQFFSALKSSGTLTAAVYAPSSAASAHTAFEEAERSGLRIVMGKTLMDRNAPADLLNPYQTEIRETETLISAWHNKAGMLYYAVSPRFAISCTSALLHEAADIAHTYNTFIQTHINEQREEIESVRECFPDSGSYTGVYNSAGLLTSRTILAHNLHPQPGELDILADSQARIAHCPDANFFLHSGTFDLQAHRNRNIPLGLGTDIGAGTTLSMFHTMRSMLHMQGGNLHPFVPYYYATLGGAQALGFERETGSIEPGKSADFIELSFEDVLPKGSVLKELSGEEVASLVVHTLRAVNVEAATVAGREVYRAQ